MFFSMLQNSLFCSQAMIQMFRVMLRRQLSRDAITEDEYKDLVTRMQDNINNIVQQSLAEQHQEEEVGSKWMQVVKRKKWEKIGFRPISKFASKTIL